MKSGFLFSSCLHILSITIINNDRQAMAIRKPKPLSSIRMAPLPPFLPARGAARGLSRFSSGLKPILIRAEAADAVQKGQSLLRQQASEQGAAAAMGGRGYFSLAGRDCSGAALGKSCWGFPIFGELGIADEGGEGVHGEAGGAGEGRGEGWVCGGKDEEVAAGATCEVVAVGLLAFSEGFV